MIGKSVVAWKSLDSSSFLRWEVRRFGAKESYDKDGKYHARNLWRELVGERVDGRRGNWMGDLSFLFQPDGADVVSLSSAVPVAVPRLEGVNDSSGRRCRW